MPDLATFQTIVQGLQAPPSSTAAAVPAASPVQSPDVANKLGILQSALDGTLKTPAAAPPASSLAENVGAGLAEGAGDVVNTAIDPVSNLVGRPIASAVIAANHFLAPKLGWREFSAADRAALLGDDDPPQLGTKLVDAASTAIGGPTPEQVVPATPAVATVRNAVRGAVGMAALGPEGGIAPAAAAGAAGATLGAAAQNVVPDAYKPLAGVMGNAVGAGSALGAKAAGEHVGATIAEHTGGPLGAAPVPVLDANGTPVPLSTVTGDPTHTQPIMATPAQQSLAGDKLAGAASDPAATAAALNDAATPLLPGSQPTTFQLTGDQGLGNFERVAATQNPELMIGRQNQQNAARVNAVQSLSDPNASPAAVQTALKAKLDGMNSTYEQAITDAKSRVQAQVEGLGGATAPGGDATTLQNLGARMRGYPPTDGSAGSSLVGANAAAKASENALWNAIDPDKTLAVDMTPIKARANDLLADMPTNAAPLAGEEKGIFDTASSLPAVQPFTELAALRSRLTDAMSSELASNGRTQSYGRMSQLLDGVHDAMAGRVALEAAQDQQAVAAGQISPNQAIMGRIGQLIDQQRELSGPERGGGGELAPAEAAGAGETAAVGGDRSGSTQGGGSGDPASNSSVAAAPAALVPNFDADAAARYQAARQATAERHTTFTNAAGVGPAIAPGRIASDFKMAPSQVPGTIFKPGAGAAERIQAYAKAGGDLPALQDYAAFSLRKAAQAPDGTLIPDKFAAWKKSHSEAVAALDQALPGVAARFDKAAEASAAVQDATARAADHVKAFQTSAVKAMLGDADPVASIGRVLDSPKSLAEMRELKAKVGSDPNALAGLRQAAVEHILKSKIGNAAAGTTGTEVMKSDAFQTFMKKAAPALRTVLSDQEVTTLRNVAADLQRSNKSIAGTKLPGGSNTAQDLAAGEKLAGGHKSLSTLGIIGAMEALGGGEGLSSGHAISGFAAGTIASIGALYVKAMHEAGVKRVDQLAQMAAFSPPLAKVLLQKAAATTAERTEQARMFKVQLNRAMVAAGAQGQEGSSGQ